MPSIITINLLGDNYSYLVISGKNALCIDPGEAGPVSSKARELGLNIVQVLNTHHHSDHCNGNAALKSEWGCTIVSGDKKRTPHCDKSVGEGDKLELGDLSIKVITVPGHTRTHVAYYGESLKALFTGDTLFSCGCGRLFEGTAADLHGSLQKLARLPADTLVYSGHDYTLDNIRFALTIEPGNKDLQKRLTDTERMVHTGMPTVPSTMSLELLTNPFLRTGSASIRKTIKLERASDVEVFAELRSRKDRF
jgi:hydroxyacylglutathione hydrolase